MKQCRRIAFGLLAMALAEGALADPVPDGTLLWVGSGGLCTHSSIQAAINAASDGALIRIANDQSYNFTNVVIEDKSLTLEGGWAQCGGVPSFSWTTLSGAAGNNNPVIQVLSPINDRIVILRGLVIRDGEGGGLHIDGRLDVTLEYASVVANQAPTGGGIHVQGAGAAFTVLRLGPVTIGASGPNEPNSNVATGSGGGLRCQDAQVLVEADTFITGNRAESGVGGGVSLNSCQLQTLAHLSISDNLADGTGGGGGLWAGNSSFVNFNQGSGTLPRRIARNQALRGAGVFLTGAGTSLVASGLVIADNHAEGAGARGGAAELSSGAQMNLQRLADNGSCTRGQTCNLITGNSAPGGGGAFYIDASALFVHQTVVSNNIGSSSIVRADSQSWFIAGNSLFHANSANSLFLLWGGSLMVLNSSTVAGNNSPAAMIGGVGDAVQNHVGLFASIIWQPGSTILSTSDGDTTEFECLNVHENTSVVGLTHDPAFVSPGTGDYRLMPMSLNIDACADPFNGADETDLIGWLRPFDAGMSNGAGPWDRGAFEFIPDGLFTDRFESM
jgi:hypothetical protein